MRFKPKSDFLRNTSAGIVSGEELRVKLYIGCFRVRVDT